MHYLLKVSLLTILHVSICGTLAAQELTVFKGLLEENDTIRVPTDIYDETRLEVKANDFYHTMVQVTEPGVVSFQLDLNQNTSGKKSYVLHGDIYLPIGMGGHRWHIGNFIHTLQFIPQVKVRIFRNDLHVGDSSMPVRTPSFMPRLTWLFTKSSWWHQDASRWSYYLGPSIFHHSNGQDGPEFKEDGSINTYNGNFAENAVFEIFFGGVKTAVTESAKARTDRIRERKEKSVKAFKTIIAPKEVHHEKYYRLGYEFHPKLFSNADLYCYNLYGRHRLNYSLGFRKIKKYDTEIYSPAKGWEQIATEWAENFRVTLHGTFIAGPLNTGNIMALAKASLADRLNVHCTYYHMIKGADNAAGFVRASYMGSDEYNIYFQDRLWLLRFGISFGFFNHG